MQNDSSTILNELKAHIGKTYLNSRSAAGKWLQYTIEQVEEGSIKLSMRVGEEMTNPMMTMHGGIMATVMDECSGLAFYSSGAPTFYATLNLNIDYLRPAPLGSRIYAQATLIRRGERIGNVQCQVFNDKEELLAQSTTNLVNTEMTLLSLEEERIKK